MSLLMAEEHVIIDANNTTISILLRNLIDNAIRYTPEKGHVKVSVKRAAQGIHLSVTDDGPGIPPELRTRVFERFFRVIGNKATGSGLGLAIVQQIAKLHGAQLKLGNPCSGQGLEVEIIFPRCPSQ